MTRIRSAAGVNIMANMLENKVQRTENKQSQEYKIEKCYFDSVLLTPSVLCSL